MDFTLTEEQRLIVDTVRAFVEKELYPHEDEVERLDEVPAELAGQIRAKAIAAGLYAANMPAELGGGGLDAVSLVLVERELGRASYALQILVERPSNILQGCNSDQRERYLIPAIRGERHDCVAMTEPGSGSDIRSMSTTARRDGDDYVVNGTKHFISHADVADFIILFAATGTETAANGQAKKKITAFLVDKDSPGLDRDPGLGLRLEPRLPPVRAVVRRLPRTGRQPARRGGTRLRPDGPVAGRDQADRRVHEHRPRPPGAGRGHASGRRRGSSSASRSGGSRASASSWPTAPRELAAAELLTLRAAAKCDEGTMTDADAAMAKLYASEMLGRMTDTAVQIFGGMGLMSQFPAERWWRDARVERIWDGTSEIQRHIIARSLLRPYGA